ncbi:hypothetical protein BDV18DRAFT_148431 [Aspergillus unguis]
MTLCVLGDRLTRRLGRVCSRFGRGLHCRWDLIRSIMTPARWRISWRLSRTIWRLSFVDGSYGVSRRGYKSVAFAFLGGDFNIYPLTTLASAAFLSFRLLFFSFCLLNWNSTFPQLSDPSLENPNPTRAGLELAPSHTSTTISVSYNISFFSCTAFRVFI